MVQWPRGGRNKNPPVQAELGLGSPHHCTRHGVRVATPGSEGPGAALLDNPSVTLAADLHPAHAFFCPPAEQTTSTMVTTKTSCSDYTIMQRNRTVQRVSSRPRQISGRTEQGLVAEREARGCAYTQTAVAKPTRLFPISNTV